jgi:acetyl esterase/lipase
VGIRRGSFRSVEDLEKAITEFMAVWNENPNPLSAPPPRNRSCRSYRVVDKPWNRFGRLYPTRQPKAPGFPTTRESHLQGNSFWPRESSSFGWHSLLGAHCGSDDVSLYAAPARAQSLAYLAQAYIAVGALDLLVDKDVTYAMRMLRAGVPVNSGVMSH